MKSHSGGVEPCPVDAKHLYGGDAPTSISWKIFILVFLFMAGCEDEEAWIQDPTPYLETEEFPGYFERIPLFGVNGHNGLKSSGKPVHCSAYGIYASSGPDGFLRAFNDSVIYSIPLERSLPFTPEKSVLQVEGKTALNGDPRLKDVNVLSAFEISYIYAKVIGGYPKIMDRIGERIGNPKSKLDLKSIETFHCAASDDRVLIFGRTYDLMYEFDLGFLFEKQGESFELKTIFARHLFKGE